MSLVECKPHVCSGSVHAGYPEVFARRNVLYVPKTNRQPDTGFGLFDESRRQILSNALFHGMPPQLKSQSLSTSIEASLEHPEIATAIYGGAIGLHYGHFITECLNTLWYYIRHGTPADKVVFHSSASLEKILATPWAADLLRLAGLRPDQIIIPRHPTVFRHLIVPGQAFSEDAFAYEGFAESCAVVGDAARAEATFESTGAPIYLSRMSGESGSVQVVNEEDLVNQLSRAGVMPVDPQNFSVADQISFFSENRTVTGIIGSAFHTSIFTRRPRAVTLATGRQVRRSYPLMDAIHGARITYLFADDLKQTEAASKFFVHLRLADPRRTAEDMLRALDEMERSGSRITSNRTSMTQKAKPIDLSEFSAFTVLTAEDQPVMMDRGSGQLHAVRHNDADMTPVMVLRMGRCAFLMADTPDAPLLTVRNETMVGPVLPYLLDSSGDFFTLANPQNGIYLTVPPARTGVSAACNASVVREWERYKLMPRELPKLAGHVTEILASVAESLAVGTHTDIAAPDVSTFLHRARLCLKQSGESR